MKTLAGVLLLAFWITFEIVIALAACNIMGWTSIPTDPLWCLLLLGGSGVAVITVMLRVFTDPIRDLK